MADSSGLGDRIKAMRKERQWTQSELARLSGMSQSNINLIESGVRSDIKYDTIIGIARAFRISTDELMGYDKDAIPEPVDGLAVKRIDALEKGFVDLSGMVQRGFEDLAARLPAAKPAEKKPAQRKRS